MFSVLRVLGLSNDVIISIFLSSHSADEFYMNQCVVVDNLGDIGELYNALYGGPKNVEKKYYKVIGQNSEDGVIFEETNSQDPEALSNIDPSERYDYYEIVDHRADGSPIFKQTKNSNGMLISRGDLIELWGGSLHNKRYVLDPQSFKKYFPNGYNPVK